MAARPDFPSVRVSMIGGMATRAPLLKGSGMRIRSQLLVVIAARVIAAAQKTGTPETAASWATPWAAWRRGPRGPSGVRPIG